MLLWRGQWNLEPLFWRGNGFYSSGTLDQAERDAIYSRFDFVTSIDRSYLLMYTLAIARVAILVAGRVADR